MEGIYENYEAENFFIHPIENGDYLIESKGKDCEIESIYMVVVVSYCQEIPLTFRDMLNI